MQIAISPKTGRPFIVEDLAWTYLKLGPHHCELLLEMLEQVQPKGFNQKQLLGSVKAILHEGLSARLPA